MENVACRFQCVSLVRVIVAGRCRCRVHDSLGAGEGIRGRRATEIETAPLVDVRI